MKFQWIVLVHEKSIVCIMFVYVDDSFGWSRRMHYSTRSLIQSLNHPCRSIQLIIIIIVVAVVIDLSIVMVYRKRSVSVSSRSSSDDSLDLPKRRKKSGRRKLDEVERLAEMERQRRQKEVEQKVRISRNLWKDLPDCSCIPCTFVHINSYCMYQ